MLLTHLYTQPHQVFSQLGSASVQPEDSKGLCQPPQIKGEKWIGNGGSLLTGKGISKPHVSSDSNMEEPHTHQAHVYLITAKTEKDSLEFTVPGQAQKGALAV